MLAVQQWSSARRLGFRGAACALRALERSDVLAGGSITSGAVLQNPVASVPSHLSWPTSFSAGRSFAASAAEGIPYERLSVGEVRIGKLIGLNWYPGEVVANARRTLMSVGALYFKGH